MKAHICLLLFIFHSLTACVLSAESPVPCLYQGRFRPVDCAAQLWLHEIHHKTRVKNSPLSAEELFWALHLNGHQAWDDTALFWVHYSQLKKSLAIDPRQNHFSYNELKSQLRTPAILHRLATQEFAKDYYSPLNRSRSPSLSLSTLDARLKVDLREETLVVQDSGQEAPWDQLHKGTVLHPAFHELPLSTPRSERLFVDEALALMAKIKRYENWNGAHSTIERTFQKTAENLQSQNLPPLSIQEELEARFPLTPRLFAAGELLRLLPVKERPGEWVSLHALSCQVYDASEGGLVPVPNFTPYSDKSFDALRLAYQNLPASQDELYTLLSQEYRALAGQVYRHAHGKELRYPTERQLRIESIYYSYPWTSLGLILYAGAALLFLFGPRATRSGLIVLALAFTLHSAILAMRCYILQRPPVSTMFETVIYVPWITMLASAIFYKIFRQRVLLIVGALTSAALLMLLHLGRLDQSMENVQAVLDSQYWLMVHVLMIVASYGVFLLAGILGHIYLWKNFRQAEEAEKTFLTQCILQTMYVGVALLIPATILGGVWAAESWGRFWDWDPKESWAFISSCIYLLAVHSYRYGLIRPLGLAVFSIIGLMSISFTWYGVNYILGTGLHSYGFGSGGEAWYYSYLAAECLYLLLPTLSKKQHLA